MFFTSCSPMNSYSSGSLLPTAVRTDSEMQMPPGVRQALEPCRHVDAVAVNVSPVLDDLPEIHANAKLDLALIGRSLLRSCRSR